MCAIFVAALQGVSWPSTADYALCGATPPVRMGVIRIPVRGGHGLMTPFSAEDARVFEELLVKRCPQVRVERCAVRQVVVPTHCPLPVCSCSLDGGPHE